MCLFPSPALICDCEAGTLHRFGLFQRIWWESQKGLWWVWCWGHWGSECSNPSIAEAPGALGKTLYPVIFNAWCLFSGMGLTKGIHLDVFSQAIVFGSSESVSKMDGLVLFHLFLVCFNNAKAGKRETYICWRACTKEQGLNCTRKCPSYWSEIL